MNISNIANSTYPIAAASSLAAEGIRQQLGRLDQNIAEVAGARSDGSRTVALLQQQQIVHAVAANAKSLQLANQAIATLLDIIV